MDVAGKLNRDAQTMHKPLNLIELRGILTDKRMPAVATGGNSQLELLL